MATSPAGAAGSILVGQQACAAARVTVGARSVRPCATSLGLIHWMYGATSCALPRAWSRSIGKCSRCWHTWSNTMTGWCDGRSCSSSSGQSALSARRRWSAVLQWPARPWAIVAAPSTSSRQCTGAAIALWPQSRHAATHHQRLPYRSRRLPHACRRRALSLSLRQLRYFPRLPYSSLRLPCHRPPSCARRVSFCRPANVGRSRCCMARWPMPRR